MVRRDVCLWSWAVNMASQILNAKRAAADALMAMTRAASLSASCSTLQ
jgi:hypothetical protein